MTDINHLRAEIERLKEQLESPFMDGYETAKEEYRPRLIAAEAENERLLAVLRYALENGIATQYHGDDDDCGTHSCCGEVSYKPHEAECWTMKARAALEEK